MGEYGTVRVEYVDDEPDPEVELGPKGSFLWFLKNRVVNQWVNLPPGARDQRIIQSCRSLERVLAENSRANPSTKEREVFCRFACRYRCWVHWTRTSSQLHTQLQNRG